MKSSPHRTPLLLAGVAFAGLVIGLVAVEIGMRVLGIEPERFPRPRWQVWYNGSFRDSNIWGNGLVKQQSRFSDQGITMGEYVPTSLFRCIYATNPRKYFDADGGVTMSVNALGLRGGGYMESAARKPGVRRILVLGDSFTFGVGVRDGDTFCRVMERRLSGSTVHGHGMVEVMNAGVQGYNTRDEVLCLEHRWLTELDPDEIVIVFYVNDAYSDETILNNGEALGVYLDRPGGLARVSRIYDFAQHSIRVRRQSRAVEELYRQHYFADAGNALTSPTDKPMDWPLCKAALARAAEIATARSKKLTVVIFPELYRLDGSYPFDSVHKLVTATCHDLGIPVLDLMDAFRGMDERSLWVHPSDHHPNEKAHAIAGSAIAEFVDLQ